jgi:hypothetical protein
MLSGGGRPVKLLVWLGGIGCGAFWNSVQNHNCGAQEALGLVRRGWVGRVDYHENGRVTAGVLSFHSVLVVWAYALGSVYRRYK